MHSILFPFKKGKLKPEGRNLLSGITWQKKGCHMASLVRGIHEHPPYARGVFVWSWTQGDGVPCGSGNACGPKRDEVEAPEMGPQGLPLLPLQRRF